MNLSIMGSTMIRYPKSRSVSKEGINLVRSIVEKANSIFHEVHDENDIGIDAHIEFIRDEKPTNLVIALQIKSGTSYYNRNTNQCVIPVGKHLDYWAGYPLPIYGIVYVPSLRNAYWINIKKYFENEYGEIGFVSHKIKWLADLNSQFNSEGLDKILTQEGGDPEVLRGCYDFDYKKIDILDYLGEDVTKIAYLLKNHSEIRIYGYALDEPNDKDQGQIVFYPPYWNSTISEHLDCLTYTRVMVPRMIWDSRWDKHFYRWHLRFDDTLGVIAVERRKTSPA
jgi:hypothetical protein